MIEFHPPGLEVLLTRHNPQKAMEKRDGRLQCDSPWVDETGTLWYLYTRAQEIIGKNPAAKVILFEDICTNGIM